MADLYVDGAALAQTRDRLKRVEDLLWRPCREIAALPSEAVAQQTLRSKLEEFGDEWSYGIGKLGEFSAAAGESLTQIDQAFGDADGKLASTLEEARRKAGSRVRS